MLFTKSCWVNFQDEPKMHDNPDKGMEIDLETSNARQPFQNFLNNSHGHRV